MDTIQEQEIPQSPVMSRGLKVITRLLCMALPVVGCFFILDTPSYLGWSVLREEYYGILIALVLGIVFLLYPSKRGTKRNRVPWYDVSLSILGFIVGLYVAFRYRRIIWEIGIITPDRIIMGIITVLLVLEGARRTTGWILVGLGVVFILYGRFAWLVPGMFGGEGIPWDRLINYLFLDPNGLLGTPTEVFAYIILAFILFGNFLFGVGGGTFIIDFSQFIFGRFRGGPAKMAVLGSSLFGTISGSAVANVVVDGWLTIPLMKKTGYRGEVAASIEALASTGGQLMPPIMGAAAFVMADFIGVPYREIAIAAIIPALLYYIALYFQIDLEAAKAGLKGLPREQLPRFMNILPKTYSFFIPLGVLIYALFILWLPAGKAAIVGVLSIIIMGFFQRETRFRFGWIMTALEETGRGLIELFLIIGIAALVIGVLNVTGLGFVFTMVLGMISGKNLIILLILAAAASTVLGMGMPTTAVYILLASLMAAALVEAGINVLAAHLFIMYTAMLSMITPPVALAAYAAANIARTDPIKTGYTAMRLGFVLFILPFCFAIWPVLVMKGSSAGEIMLCFFSEVLGIFLICTSLVGYFFSKLNLAKRVLLGLAGFGFMILPKEPFFTVGLVSHIIGGIILLGLILWEWGKSVKFRKQSVQPQVLAK